VSFQIEELVPFELESLNLIGGVAKSQSSIEDKNGVTSMGPRFQDEFDICGGRSGAAAAS
jgi:hypothetical protein